MTLEKAAQDLWAGVVALSLIGIGLAFAVAVERSAVAVVNARRRARILSRHLYALARWCSVSELEEIDRTLRRIWAAERGSMFRRLTAGFPERERAAHPGPP